ncbi:MAG: phage major capsid protein [Pseudomonadota bacterium]
MIHNRKSALLRGAIELKDAGDDPNEIVQKALNDLTKSVDDRLKALEEKGVDPKLIERLDRIEAKVNRPGTDQDGDDESIEHKAFDVFLRKGREALGADEVKTLRVSDDTAGGYLATPEFVAEVDKNLVQFSPIRAAARVGQTASGSVIIPKRTGRPTGSWVGETEARPGTESTYGQAEIPVDEMACYVDVSNKLLEDAAIDVSAEVAFDVAEEFGRMEGEAFVMGNGVKKPLGFMSDANVAFTVSGSASVIADADGTVDGIIDLMYALHPFYRSRGAFMANGLTIAALRKLKDGDDKYIWQPALVAGQPDTLLGRPIVEAPDMPAIEAGAFPLVFGDFASAFRIYDRVGLSILRDPYSLATTGCTRFHARKRVGARLVRPEAIRKLKIAAS